jgi:hypothetical protein
MQNWTESFYGGRKTDKNDGEKVGLTYLLIDVTTTSADSYNILSASFQSLSR